MNLFFWISIIFIFYTYVGYPILLKTIIRFKNAAPRSLPEHDVQPTVSMIIPVHNEEDVIRDKIQNVLDLDYSADRLEVLFISDGSTDNTVKILMEHETSGLKCHAIPVRSGKASALNLGLEKAKGEILVFTDASIMLEKGSLKNIVRHFTDLKIGCVSGEDHIAESSGEGLYGKYELTLRRWESEARSIVGASGSFYAQRRVVGEPFPEGMAPDFFSVLVCAEKGFRAVTDPSAKGSMASVKNPGDEFKRKVRTFLRGMTTLFQKKRLLNPFIYGFFAVELLSHKIFRWFVPIFLLAIYVSNAFLIDEAFYVTLFVVQNALYIAAVMPFFWKASERVSIVRYSHYFLVVNAAALAALLKYLHGERQEIWTPSRRKPTMSGRGRIE